MENNQPELTKPVLYEADSGAYKIIALKNEATIKPIGAGMFDVFAAQRFTLMPGRLETISAGISIIPGDEAFMFGTLTYQFSSTPGLLYTRGIECKTIAGPVAELLDKPEIPLKPFILNNSDLRYTFEVGDRLCRLNIFCGER
jgi:hypothetical protein